MSHFLLTLRLTRSLQCFLICFLALPRAPTMGYSNLGGKKRELVERPPTGIKNRERECCKQTRANSMPDRSVIRVLTPPDWLTDRQTDHWTDESLHTEFHSICKSQDLVLLWKFNHLRLVLRYVNDLASLFSNYPTTPLINEWRMIVPFSWSEGLGEVLVSVLLGNFVI
jgi:hypothetical protein